MFYEELIIGFDDFYFYWIENKNNYIISIIIRLKLLKFELEW